jgi:hypothetical protein
MYGRQVDIIATKDGKTIAIEAKTNKSAVMKWLASSDALNILPKISLLYLAIPQALVEDDILSFAKNLRVGVMTVTTDGKIKWLLVGDETGEGAISTGSSVPNRVLPGETFEIKLHLQNRSAKIVPDIEFECIPVTPFRIARGERKRKKIPYIEPGREESFSFSIVVDEKATPGVYTVFLKNMADGRLRTDYFRIQVASLLEEDVRTLVSQVVSELDTSISNISKALEKIQDSILKGVIDIRSEIIDKSIWNEVGIYCLAHGLYQQARAVYEAMLQTIEQYEQQHPKEKPVHKGLALHNLGIALYNLGQPDEAKRALERAYEEDQRTFGLENAKKGLAKKALETLAF